MEPIAGEFARSLPAGSTAMPIRIIGGDLEKRGITQNQQVRDFDQENQTLADVLTAMVLKANPTQGVSGPEDPEQALVWAIDRQSDPPSIVITTRDAVPGRYELPAIFGSSMPVEP